MRSERMWGHLRQSLWCWCLPRVVWFEGTRYLAHFNRIPGGH